MNLAIWNMQGGNNYDQAAFLLINDYVCLQECGTPPKSWGIDLPAGAGNGLYVGSFTRNVEGANVQFHSAYYRWSSQKSKKPKYRCSQLILSRFIRTAITQPVFLPDPAGRPVLGWEVAAGHWVFSVHSPSMGTCTAHLLQMTNQMAAVQNFLGVNTRWVVAGDLNYQADDPTIDVPFPNRVVHGPYPTQQGGVILDYVITGPSPNNAPTYMDHTGQGQVSDHYAQYFRLTW